MAKINIESVKKAVELFLDNPDITNAEIGKQLGVSEMAVRYWKKSPIWEEEKAKLESERAEAVQDLLAKRKEEYQQKLEENAKDLEILLKSAKRFAAQSLALSNRGYDELLKEPDALKASSKGVRCGVHIHAKAALEALKNILFLNEQIYQLRSLTNYLSELDTDDNEQN